ncbi:MAG: alpha/beta hydrolase [Alphaproteobacteria bacterium]
MKTDLQKLNYNNEYIAYIKQNSKLNKHNICIIFFSGFMSDLNSSKAQFISEYCKENDIEYIRFDYFGHGNSSGDFEEGTIGKWLDNALHIIDNITDKKIIIAGSSMGAWIMILAALERKDRIKALLGISSAADFTENLVWDYFNETQKAEIIKNKKILLPSDYCEHNYLITLQLIEEGRNHLILDKEIDLDLPTMLIHSLDDNEVPYETSMKLAKQMKNKDLKLVLVKGEKHNMNSAKAYKIIEESLNELINI